MTEREILQELGEIVDRLHAMSPEDRAQRSSLTRRREELSRLLSDEQPADAKDLKDRRGQRAARKPGEAPSPVIPSPKRKWQRAQTL